MVKVFTTATLITLLTFTPVAHAQTNLECIDSKFHTYYELMKQQHMFFKTHAEKSSEDVQNVVNVETEFQLAFLDTEFLTFKSVYTISPEKMDLSLPLPAVHSAFSVSQQCSPMGAESNETKCRFAMNEKMKSLFLLENRAKERELLQEKIDLLNNKNFLKKQIARTPAVKEFYQDIYPKMIEKPFHKEIQELIKTPKDLGC